MYACMYVCTYLCMYVMYVCYVCYGPTKQTVLEHTDN